jgi:hypothetical protein
MLRQNALQSRETVFLADEIRSGVELTQNAARRTRDRPVADPPPAHESRGVHG